MPAIPSYHTVSVADRRTGSALKLFYREAGSEDAPWCSCCTAFPPQAINTAA